VLDPAVGIGRNTREVPRDFERSRQNAFGRLQLVDQALFEGMQKLQLEAQQKYDVNATPTFIVTSGKNSDGEKISGSQPYEVFEKAFAKALQ